MVEAPKYIEPALEESRLKVLSDDIGEGVEHGNGQRYFLRQRFTNRKFAEEAIAAFPRRAVRQEPIPWKGGYDIELLRINFTEAEKQEIRKALAAARKKDDNFVESVAEVTTEFKDALSARDVGLTKNEKRLIGDTEVFELELTKLFEYRRHAYAAIGGWAGAFAKVEPVEVDEGGEKRTKYRVVFDAEPLSEAKLKYGQEWFEKQVGTVAGAYSAEAEEIKKRTERSKAILEAFGDKETQPTHRLFEINNTGFDKRANAQAVASALGGAEVVEGKNGAKFYIRVTNSLAVTDDNLNKAVALAQQKREQEQKLLADFGSLIGEEFVPYEPTDEVRKANGSVGYRYRVKAGYANKDYVDLAHKALAQFDSSMVKVVQEGDERVLLLNASLLKPEMLVKIRTETKAAILAARTEQNKVDEEQREQEAAQELRSAIATTLASLKDYSPTQEDNGVAFRPGITDATKLGELVGKLNAGANGQPLYEEFATITGEGKEAVVTLNMENRPDNFAERVTAAKDSITTQRQTELEAEKNKKREAVAKLLTDTFPGKFTRDGAGGALTVPKEVEAEMFKALGFTVDPNNAPGFQADGKMNFKDLLDIKDPTESIPAAKAILVKHESNLAAEAARKEKTEKLQVLSDTPIVPKADAPDLVSVFFKTPAEAQVVAIALGGDEVAKIPDPNNPGIVEVNLKDLDVSKIADAQKAQDDVRTAQAAAAEQQAKEEEQKRIRLAEEEKKKKESKDQTNMWINIGGPILGAIVGLFMGGGFSIGGIISAIAVGAAAWIGTQAFTETGLFAKPEAQTPNTPAAPANGTSPQVSGPAQQQDQGQGAALPNGTPVAPLPTPTVDPNAPAAGTAPPATGNSR